MWIRCAVVLLGVGLLVPSDSRAGESDLPRLHVVGDSTANNNFNGGRGWGNELAPLFDAEVIAVVNRARGGRSSRTYRSEGLWGDVLEGMKPGDYVLLQFGHNDPGGVGVGMDRGSLPGLGEETVTITNRAGQVETVHTYGWYMRASIAEAREKGATPIVLTPTVRNEWPGGRVERGPGLYRAWAAAVARDAGALLIDHTALIADEYERQGQEAVRAFFGPDHTHTSPAGAALNARLVVAGLRALEGHDFAQFLSEAGRAVEARRPAAADVRAQGRAPRRVGPVHAGFDPALPTVWLIGDSTVKNSWGVGADGLWGWGNPIAAYFDRSRINVENQALGGTSSRSFRTLGLWEEVRVQVKQGDHVIMQFGHNDGGGAQGGPGGRGSIRGNGEETVEVVLPATGEKEEVHTYGWYLRKTCEEVLAAGAIPIVCSPVPRNGWVDGKVRRASDDYAAWAREAAAAAGAQFIDLNSLIADRYDAMGEEAVKPLFPKDHTHTGWAGAVVNARCVFNGIRTLGDCGLKDFLLTDPEDPVEPPPSRPDMG